MKKILINTIVLATGILLFTGCEKDDSYKAAFDKISGDAQLKVIYASAYTTNPGVQLSIDDVRVSSLITGRTPFPGGGYNTSGANWPDYLKVDSGVRKFTISIPKKNTNVDSVVLYTTQINLVANRKQSLHVMDTFTRTKSVLVTDTVTSPGRNNIKYRFVNLMPNAPALDLYFGTTRVATNVLYNTQGVTFGMTVPASGALAWTIRETGTSPTSTALATYTSASTITSDRIYTAFAMGYKGSSATNTKPYISFSINR